MELLHPHVNGRPWRAVPRSREYQSCLTRSPVSVYNIGMSSESSNDSITLSPGPQFRLAMLLAIVADVLQLLVVPAFVEGALSPADDLLDLGIAAMMVRLLGWHWEFLPSFLVKLVPGADLVPFWSIAVASVWRKAKAAGTTQVQDPGKNFLPQ